MAVGTDRLFSIFVTIAAPTPRSGSRVEPSGTAVTGATAEVVRAGAAGAGADAAPFVTAATGTAAAGAEAADVVAVAALR